MSNQFVIGVEDQATADFIEQELRSLGVQLSRGSNAKGISFGALHPDKIKTYIEIIGGIGAIITTAPETLDGINDLIDRFKHVAHLFVDGKPTTISEQREKIKQSQPGRTDTMMERFNKFCEDADVGAQKILDQLRHKPEK